jgi:hypothetical protein
LDTMKVFSYYMLILGAVQGFFALNF